MTHIGPNLAKRISKVYINPLSFVSESLKETLFGTPVTETEINKIERALMVSATGHDDVNWQFLKLALNFVVDQLTHICYMPLADDVLSNTLKVANIIPLVWFTLLLYFAQEQSSDKHLSFNTISNFNDYSYVVIRQKETL